MPPRGGSRICGRGRAKPVCAFTESIWLHFPMLFYFFWQKENVRPPTLPWIRSNVLSQIIGCCDYIAKIAVVGFFHSTSKEQKYHIHTFNEIVITLPFFLQAKFRFLSKVKMSQVMMSHFRPSNSSPFSPTCEILLNFRRPWSFFTKDCKINIWISLSCICSIIANWYMYLDLAQISYLISLTVGLWQASRSSAPLGKDPTVCSKSTYLYCSPPLSVRKSAGRCLGFSTSFISTMRSSVNFQPRGVSTMMLKKTLVRSCWKINFARVCDSLLAPGLVCFCPGLTTFRRVEARNLWKVWGRGWR